MKKRAGRSTQKNRRQFLGRAAAGGAALGLSELALPELSFLNKLPTVSAAETALDPMQIRLKNGIGPLVTLLEETPRDRLLESVAAAIQSGTSYREILAALLLASVRNVRPHPSVGFKFHAVLVVNSAHLASLASASADRWLPIFWAIDYFKSQQLEEQRTSGWTMRPVDEKVVPPARRARKMFVNAMERWDEEAADVAITGLARTAGANEIFELMCRFGARDFRAIGHKAIFVANSWRTLQCIGWHHAEPVLRSLTSALLNHHGEPNPAISDLPADSPWRRNDRLEKTVRADWQEGTISDDATHELLQTLRSGSPDDASDLAVKLLNRGIAPQSIWDAVLVGSGELLMRQPGIIGLHSQTTANALLHAYQVSGDDSTRRMLLLQNCAFLPMFRQAAIRRGDVSDATIDDLETADLEPSSTGNEVGDIFVDVSEQPARAARQLKSYLQAGGDPQTFMAAARRLIFLKGTNAHDYKYSSAVLEDYYHASPPWRHRFLALSVFNLRGSEERDNQLVRRTRAALGA